MLRINQILIDFVRDQDKTEYVLFSYLVPRLSHPPPTSWGAWGRDVPGEEAEYVAHQSLLLTPLFFPGWCSPLWAMMKRGTSQIGLHLQDQVSLWQEHSVGFLHPHESQVLHLPLA